MDENHVDVAKESSTPVINEQANTTEEHAKQLHKEEESDEIIISSKKSNDTTNQTSARTRKRELNDQKYQRDSEIL